MTHDPHCECVLCDQTLHPDDHVKVLGETEWHTVRQLRAAARGTPPDSYAPGSIAMRAAAATPESRFEDRYKADRLRDLEATRATLDAVTKEVAAIPRMTAAELAAFAPPDPYAAGIAALRAEKTR